MNNDFNEPAYPVTMFNQDGTHYRQDFGLTIRQQAALMAPTSEIDDLLPDSIKDCADFLGVPLSEYLFDPIGNHLKVIAKVRCMWADAVLKRERETRSYE